MDICCISSRTRQDFKSSLINSSWKDIWDLHASLQLNRYQRHFFIIDWDQAISDAVKQISVRESSPELRPGLAVGSMSLSISVADNSCSWVLVHALGLIVKEEFKSVMLGGGWRCGELLVSSSTFAVIQRICKSVPPQKHPHWKNTNTQLQYSLYCCSLDWWW